MKPNPDALERCRRELESLGVDTGFAEAIVPTLVELSASSDTGPTRSGFLAGVVAAYAVHRDALERLRRSLREVNEMGRLVDAFGGELEKLDEALRTLGAYVERMRTQTASDDDERVIH